MFKAIAFITRFFLDCQHQNCQDANGHNTCLQCEFEVSLPKKSSLPYNTEFDFVSDDIDQVEHCEDYEENELENFEDDAEKLKCVAAVYQDFRVVQEYVVTGLEHEKRDRKCNFIYDALPDRFPKIRHREHFV